MANDTKEFKHGSKKCTLCDNYRTLKMKLWNVGMLCQNLKTCLCEAQLRCQWTLQVLS